MSDTPRRGPYAKGIARREQILHEALLAYSESDSSGPSLRSIAARVGLSERGLLHYFASRDELFISILERRDSSDRQSSGDNPSLEALAEVQAHSAETPGLVRLFLEMAAAAPDPAHYGHEFFTGRYRRLRELVSRRFRSIAGESKTPIPSEDDAAFVARVLIAASDGLQVQWLLDPSIDMRADLVRLARVLRSEAAVGQKG
jgi:AcrR family transcriptional regulator